MDTGARNEDKVGIVFIPGAGLDRWIWDKVAGTLEYPCLLADYPFGKALNESRKNLTLNDYIEHLKNQVEKWQVSNFVIVAHSLGGVLGLKLASELNSKLKGFIAVGAVIPRSGGSFLSTLPFHQRVFTSALIRMLGTKPPESAIRKGLCNDISAEYTAKIVDGFIPESVHVYTDRIQVSIPMVPRLYVKLDKDKQLSPSLQNQMIYNLSPQEVRSMDSGHLPMLSDPDGLRAVLADFMEKVEH